MTDIMERLTSWNRRALTISIPEMARMTQEAAAEIHQLREERRDLSFQLADKEDQLDKARSEIERLQRLTDELDFLAHEGGPEESRAAIRSDALEEAARFADEYKGFVRAELVAGIRALKEKP